jgi:PAS domain S-box-containing protein
VDEWLGYTFLPKIHPDDRDITLNGFNEIVAGSKYPTPEIRVLTKSGEYILFEIKGSPRIKNGEIIGLLGFAKNIHEQREAERKLRESEAKYRDLVERADIGITIIQEGRVEFLNKALADMANLKVEEVIGRPFVNFVHPKALPEIIKRYEKRMVGEEVPSAYETTFITNAGKSVDVEISAGLITFDQKPADLVLVRNVTEKRRVLRELQESETRYRTLITTAMEGVWVTDLDNKTIYVNPALEKILGWTLDEMRGKSVENYLSSESIPIFDKITHERYTNGIPSSTYSLTFIQKDGSNIITRVAGTALYNTDNEIIGSFGFISDITAEKTAQERYRSLIEFNPDAITLTDLQFNIVAVNDQAIKLNGAKSAEELIGRKAFDFIAPEDRERAMKNAAKTLEEGTRLIFEYKLLKLDGSTFPAELIVSTIVDEKGDPTSFIGITRDISDRKKAEQQLVESERKYRTLVENINSGIFRVSVEGKLLQCNPAFLEMFGYDSIEEINKSDLSLLYVNQDDREIFVEELYKEGEINIRDILMKKKDETTFWASISSRLAPEKKYHDGIIEDISERKRVEETISQVKLEEERYHAMLSHFVRNDLQKIVNNLDYIFLEYQSKKTLKGADIREITSIAKHSSRSIDIVNQIFEVLQTPFTPERITRQKQAGEIIKETCTKSSMFRRPFDVKTENLNFEIIDDKYIQDAFFEIIRYLADQEGKRVVLGSPITIDGTCINSQVCFIIRDYVSIPIPPEVCTRLSGKITEEWEYHGHYLSITLAAVIIQHYGGQLKIYPSESKGNEFQLWFPGNFLRSSCT